MGLAPILPPPIPPIGPEKGFGELADNLLGEPEIGEGDSALPPIPAPPPPFASAEVKPGGGPGGWSSPVGIGDLGDNGDRGICGSGWCNNVVGPAALPLLVLVLGLGNVL